MIVVIEKKIDFDRTRPTGLPIQDIKTVEYLSGVTSRILMKDGESHIVAGTVYDVAKLINDTESPMLTYSTSQQVGELAFSESISFTRKDDGNSNG